MRLQSKSINLLKSLLYHAYEFFYKSMYSLLKGILIIKIEIIIRFCYAYSVFSGFNSVEWIINEIPRD